MGDSLYSILTDDDVAEITCVVVKQNAKSASRDEQDAAVLFDTTLEYVIYANSCFRT